jgi:hypothetical protein
MPRKSKTRPPVASYDQGRIVDAPEHYEFSRGMGLLTWGTWDHDVRPFEERVRDFVFAYPPGEPARNSGLSLVARPDGSYGPGTIGDRVARFDAHVDPRTGSLPELLARYGLKLRDGPQYSARPTSLDPFVDVARRRNKKLRVVYGSVDQEPSDMDAAKADFLEKRQAAQEIRDARKQMQADLQADAQPPPTS